MQWSNSSAKKGVAERAKSGSIEDYGCCRLAKVRRGLRRAFKLAKKARVLSLHEVSFISGLAPKVGLTCLSLGFGGIALESVWIALIVYRWPRS